MSLPIGRDTIPLAVSPQAAEFFRSLPKEKREKLEAILRRTLEDAARGKRTDLALGVQTAILSEPTLAKIWDSPEEDEAWKDL